MKSTQPGMEVRSEIGPCLPKQPQQETREDELEDFGFETFTDVDIRLRWMLDEAFEVEDSGNCIMLVLHNRSNKSLLRTLGHTQDEVHNLDLENCAILPYLVERTRLTNDEVQTRKGSKGEGEGSGQRSNDLTIALRDKSQQHGLAAKELRKLSEEDFQNLENYLIGEKERGDTWAICAIEDLYNCRGGT